MMSIPEFGVGDAGADYVLRPGGYVVLQDDAGRIALVSTPFGFALPGGGQEPGESAEQAAIRETLEECGLHIRIDATLGMADELVFAAGENRHYRKRCTFFLASVVSSDGRVTEPDHELVWLSPAEAAARLLHGSQRWAVAEAGHRRKL